MEEGGGEGGELPEVRGGAGTTGGGVFPFGFKKEFKELFKLAWPTSLSIMFHQLIQPISLMFVGHLGKTELAGVALALSWIYIWCVSLGRGLAFAGDTFFSQTYGSANKTRVGVYLQRSIYFGVLVSCPICAILLNTKTFLLLMRQDPQVVEIAADYCTLFLPGVVAYAWLFTLMRYLLCQSRVIGNLLITIVSCGICAILHYGLVYQAKMGIQGSAISLMLTYYLTLILLTSYIWGSGLYKETWSGWSWDGLRDWGPFARVALPSLAMTYIFWLCTEIGTFLAGLLGDESISAYSIMWQVEGFAWMVPLGLGGACTARIGQYLGSNQPLGALTTSRVALTIQVLISVVMGGLTFALKDYIPAMFTANRALISYTGGLMPFVAVFLLLEGFGGVGVGIIRGTGRQAIGTIILLVSYYVVALPLGIPLMFLTKLGLAGIWWGNDAGLLVQDICLVFFVIKINWQEESNKALERAGVTTSRQVTNINTQEVDETTHLLGHNQYAPELTTSVNETLSNSLSNNSINAEFSSDPTFPVGLLLKRLFTLFLFVSVLAVGVLLRLYVKLPVDWSTLCLPQHNITEVTAGGQVTITPIIENVTLAPCDYNVTMTYAKFDYPFYGLRV